MSIKIIADKFLETHKFNEKTLRKLNPKPEEYELVPKIKNRRISSIFKARERKVSQFTIDCITTMLILYSSFIFGWVTNKYSLAHKELDQSLPSSYSSLKSTTFSISFAFGSLLSSLSVNLFGQQISSSFFLILIGVTQVLSSDMNWIVFVINSVKGISCGALITTLIVWIIDIWRHKCSPFLQSLFFFITLSIFVEPLVQRQYIFVKQKPDFVCQTNSVNMEKSGNYLTQSNHNLSDDYNKYLTKTVDRIENNCNETVVSKIPQICVLFLAICGVALLFILYKSHEQYIKKNRISLRKSNNSFRTRLLNKTLRIECLKSWKKSFYIICISLLLSFYLTIELSNIKLLSFYSHSSDSQIKGEEFRFIRIILFGSQTVFACISIFVSLVMRPKIILIINLLVISVANISLILFATNSYKTIKFVSILMGCGFCSSLAAIFSILEQYIRLDNNIGSIVIFLATLITSIKWEIISYFIDARNSLFFICLNFISIIFALIILTVIWVSKNFINSESFTLRTVNNEAVNRHNSCHSYKFESEHNSEYNDTFCSNGSYLPRDTSIVSIHPMDIIR